VGDCCGVHSVAEVQEREARRAGVRQKIQRELDRQRIHLQLLDEITSLLQDNVNNPLAVISISSHTIRHKFETDEETLGWLDRIDASLQHVHTTINDIKAYQMQKSFSRPRSRLW
jgi:hypothetical protein